MPIPKTLALVVVSLMAVELLVAVFTTHWLHRHIFSADKELGPAMRRLSLESPRASLLVKAMYGLILAEFAVTLLAKFFLYR